jgi:DNA polymerase (family X)
MRNREVAETLDEVARLLEVSGENAFKVKSYSNAARTIERLKEDIARVTLHEQLRELPGIGEALAEKIRELVHTGRLAYLEELRKKFPETLHELFRLQGLGPGRIRMLYQGLGIESLEDLERACQLDQVKNLKGFGPKMQDKILNAIRYISSQQGRFLLNRAFVAAKELLEYLRGPGLHIRMELGGSLRRTYELIRDIDVIASAPQAAPLMSHFLAMPGAEVRQKEATISSLVLPSGIPADLRIVPDNRFPCALIHFTGSREHNGVLRQRARQKGWQLNENGLFQKDGRMLPIADEPALYRALHLPFIPPELRENQYEFSGAPMPELAEMRDLKGVIHCHTSYSDGHNTLVEMASACQGRGYQYLVVNDHSQSANYAGGLPPAMVLEQHQEIETLSNTLDGFRVLKGIESDIRPDGTLDYDLDLLKRFDIVIVSIHSRLEMSEAEATARLIRAVEHPCAHILGHPTGRLLLSRPGYPVDMRKVLDACAANHTAVEVNANCRRLDLDWRWIKYARDKGIKIAIGPDAHNVDRLDFIPYGLAMARKGWIEAHHLLNTMTAGELLAWRK